MNRDDEKFEQRVRTTLESSVSGLDAETRSRLSAIRREAISHHKPRASGWLRFGAWAPATAFAACAVLAVVLLMDAAPPGGNEQVALEEAEVALELFLGEDTQELPGDPDFYVWLDEILLEEETPDHAG